MDSKATKTGDPSKLTHKQRQFVREYLIDRNATQAAIRCGYSAKTAKQQGSRLLSYADIQAAIEVGNAKAAERAELTVAGVLNDIKTVVSRCMQQEPVLDKDGNPTGEYRFEASPALKGLELLGRHLSIWNDKTTIKGDANDPLTVVLKGIQGAAFKPVKSTIDEDEE